jgi:hypothetical protein
MDPQEADATVRGRTVQGMARGRVPSAYPVPRQRVPRILGGLRGVATPPPESVTMFRTSYGSGNNDDPFTPYFDPTPTFPDGAIFVFLTNQLIKYHYDPYTVATGWTAIVNDDTNGRYAIWAPATSGNLAALTSTPITSGYLSGDQVLLVVEGADLTAPVEDWGWEATWDSGDPTTAWPSPARDRAAVTCTADTLFALNVNFHEAYFFDNAAGAGVDVSGIGSGITATFDGTTTLGTTLLVEANPGAGDPSWPTAQTLLYAGTASTFPEFYGGSYGDFHHNVSLAIKRA